MWLATIDSKRVRKDLRPKLVAYQMEAAEVLRTHFLGAPATAANTNIDPRLIALTDRLISRTNYLTSIKDGANLSDASIDRFIAHCEALITGTIPANGPRLIDVTTYLRNQGLTSYVARRNAAQFGKFARRIYQELNDKPPKRVHRYVSGSERLVNSYTEDDLPVFDLAFEQMFGRVPATMAPRTDVLLPAAVA